MIFVDMDGVMTDFIRKASEVHGRNPKEVFDNWPNGVSDITDVLGIPKTEFWQKIDDCGTEFWSSMPATPWIDRLLEVLNRCPEWAIASSPSRHPNSVAGKVEWIQKKFGVRFRDYYLTGGCKSALAGRGHILIDDMSVNCVRWLEAGGYPVLFPRPWKCSAKTMEAFWERLEEVCDCHGL